MKKRKLKRRLKAMTRYMNELEKLPVLTNMVNPGLKAELVNAKAKLRKT